MTWLASLALVVAGLLLAPDVGRGITADTAWFVDPGSSAARQEAVFRAAGNDADADALHAVAEVAPGGLVRRLERADQTAVARRLEQIEAVQASALASVRGVQRAGRDCSGSPAGGANTATSTVPGSTLRWRARRAAGDRQLRARLAGVDRVPGAGAVAERYARSTTLPAAWSSNQAWPSISTAATAPGSRLPNRPSA